MIWFARDDDAGGHTNFGHSALRVYGENYDLTVDFGRYRGGRGLFKTEGDGILQLWSNFQAFLAAEDGRGSSIGRLYHTSEEFDTALIRYFWSIAEESKQLVTSPDKEVYQTTDDYDLFSNNCTTIAAKGIMAARGSAQPGTEDRILIDDAAGGYMRTIDPREVFKMISTTGKNNPGTVILYFRYTPPKKKK